MMLKRTAKSCRSGAPMLASSLREEAQATVSNKPGHRGEREVSRKTIARGMPGLLRCTCGDYARVLYLISHARLRVHWAPGIPCALCYLGANGFCKARAHRAARMRSLDVIARSKATKQSTLTSRQHGLLRGACHRARVRATRWLAMTTKLLRRGTDRRTAGWPMQVGDRHKRAQPRTDRREGDVDPVFGIADHGVGREQIPYAAPRRCRHAPARHHRRGEHDIDRIGCGSRKQNAPGGQRIEGSH